MDGRTFNASELDKLFHLRDDYHGEIPLYPVYDPEYDGEQYRDLDEFSEWYIWVTNEKGELDRLAGYPDRGLYFGTEAEHWSDIHYPFFNFYIQQAMFSNVTPNIDPLIVDVRHLSTSMAKIGLFEYLSRRAKTHLSHFVISEVEYIITTCRSMYERLQRVIKATWEQVEYREKEGQPMQMPEKFARIALEDGEPASSEDLQLKRNLPEEIADYYENEADGFSKIRELRNKIMHEGETISRLYITEDGIAVKRDNDLFEPFSDVWDEEDVKENNLAPLWPMLAYIIRETSHALNRFVLAISDCIEFPEPIAPDHLMFLRGGGTRYLPYLDYLIEVDPWGVYIVEDVRQRILGE